MFEKFFKKPKNKVETVAKAAAVVGALSGAPAEAAPISVFEQPLHETVIPSASNEQKPIVGEQGKVDLERVRTNLGLSTDKTPVDLQRETTSVDLTRDSAPVDLSRNKTPVNLERATQAVNPE